MILIWDFNGTLLDDVQIGIDSINVLLRRRHLPTLQDREAYQAVFRFPIIDYYASLGLDVTGYDALAHEWMAEYLARAKAAPLYEGATAVLAELKRRGIRQVLLSATEQEQLEKQVRDLGIAPYFVAILGQGDIYASSKVARAKRYFADCREPMLLVGDTDHDLDTANAIGADCVLCSHGHQSREALMALNDRVIASLPDLLPYLTKEEVLL